MQEFVLLKLRIMDEEKGLPIIIEDKCTGCGKCVEECPRSIITLLPAREQVVEACVFCFPRDQAVL